VQVFNLKRSFAPTGNLGRRTGAQMGAIMAIAAEAFALPTFLTTSIRPDLRIFTVVMMALSPVLALAAAGLPWERIHRRWLLAWPLWTFVGVAFSGSVTFEHGAPALTGLFVVAFFYVGMTQARGTSLVLLPIALVCWVAAYGGWSHDLALRAPLAIGVWVLVAETLAAMHHQMRTLTVGLVRAAGTDPLTGLGNRRDLARHLRTLRPADAVVVLDVDNFKTVNDRFGHSAGDKVLADLGAVIRGGLRANDIAIRLGGEEMLLIVTDGGAAGAREVLARLSANWARIQPGVTFSAGVCVVGDVDAADAVGAADAALYRAKRDGRNCWRFADSTTVVLPDEARHFRLADEVSAR
jgi:diguanylate cyclase (GGDEF)-like protein